MSSFEGQDAHTLPCIILQSSTSDRESDVGFKGATSQDSNRNVSSAVNFVKVEEYVAPLQVACGSSKRKSSERSKWRLISGFFLYFICGWGDGITGTILPYIKAEWNLSYLTSSLLFIASFVGFTTGTLLIESAISLLGRFHLDKLNGLRHIFFTTQSQDRAFQCAGDVKSDFSFFRARGLILALASILHAGFFMLMGSDRGFASVMLAYLLAAFSRAFLTGTMNAYIASTPSKPLGQLHGCWGFGAFIGPLVCQTLLNRGIKWPHFYLGSLVLSIINSMLLIYSFRPTNVELSDEWRTATPLAVQQTELISSETESQDRQARRKQMSTKQLCGTFKSPYVWAFSLFAWVYSGSETTTQGYMASYLLAIRHAHPGMAGYVTSGFWAGMAVSRIISGFASPQSYKFYAEEDFDSRSDVRLGDANIFFIQFSLVYQILASSIENIISASLIGVLYGPIFPGLLFLATEVLPEEIHLLTMATISMFASFGSCLFPFITGAIANDKGLHVLVFMTVAQVGIMIVAWSFFPIKRPCRASDGIAIL